MIPDKLLKKYYAKSGEKNHSNENLTVNEHGFATYKIQSDGILIIDVCGDGKYWDNFFVNMAKKNGLNKVRFVTKRNPKGYTRKYKYKAIATVMEKEV